MQSGRYCLRSPWTFTRSQNVFARLYRRVMKEQLKVSVFELLMHVRQASSLCMAVLFTGNAVRVCVCAFEGLRDICEHEPGVRS